MAKLIYSAIASLDGYIEDETRRFDWAAPDAEVHAAANELASEAGTYLYGRRMYEVMRFWETAHEQQDLPAVGREFAEIWQAADKVVFSRSLDAVSTARTRLESDFSPEVIRDMKAAASRDLSIGGPELAGQAFGAGLVDEFCLFLVPILVGGGKSAFPAGVKVGLALLDERRFGNGTVYLRYRCDG
jgi:dihydrofolate reductase